MRDAQAGGLAEVKGEFARLCGFFSILRSRVGAQTTGGDGEEFSPDINETAKQDLLAFEFRAEADHGVEQGSREFSTRACGVTHVLHELAIHAGGIHGIEWQPLPRIPAGIKTS